MARLPDFYSINEAEKPVRGRRYHNNGACLASREIPYIERRRGQNGYQLCEGCDKLNRQGR